MSNKPTSYSIEERVTRIESAIDSFREFAHTSQSQLSAINDKLSQRERTNWPVLLSIFGLIITMAIGAFFVVKQEISTRATPLEAAARVSESDRGRLNQEVSMLRGEVVSGKAEISNLRTGLGEQLKEIETQFRAVSQLSNTRTAYNQQMFGLLWHKVYDQQLPPVNYFSDMSQPKAHGN